MSWYAPAVVLLVLLAGCSDAPAAPARPDCPVVDDAGVCVELIPDEERIKEFEDPDHYCVANRLPRQNAPDLEGNHWTLGQWWRFDLTRDGNTTSTKMVYYEDQDQGAHYMIGTPTREEAVEHALYSINPLIGRIHAQLYSPHESGDHADMFHFPLCDGSTWTTRFFGEMFRMEAAEAQIEVPGKGPLPGYKITGRADGASLELTYSLDAQWFTLLAVTKADGTAVRMELAETGRGYTGPAHFLRAQQDHVEAFALNVTPVPLDTLTIVRGDGGEGPYDTIAFAIDAAIDGTFGQANLTLLDPSGAVAFSAALGLEQVAGLGGMPSVQVVQEVPYQAGNWTLEVSGVGALASSARLSQVSGEIRMVSIYDRSGAV